MAFTQTDLDAVNAAVASGELKIEVAGRMVMYRSMDELIKARDIIQADLASAATASTSAVRRGSYAVRFSTARGF
jgi:adenylate kinase